MLRCRRHVGSEIVRAGKLKWTPGEDRTGPSSRGFGPRSGRPGPGSGNVTPRRERYRDGRGPSRSVMVSSTWWERVYEARSPPNRSLRLVVQDTALSRRRQGFESPRERHPVSESPCLRRGSFRLRRAFAAPPIRPAPHVEPSTGGFGAGSMRPAGPSAPARPRDREVRPWPRSLRRGRWSPR